MATSPQQPEPTTSGAEKRDGAQSPAPNPKTLARFEQLLKQVAEARPNDDLSIIRRAFELSERYHAGQTRASGEPYLVHPIEVALVLAEMKMDPPAIAAGL